nr:probable 28S ribosomal protein S26, mitochondrial [Procambarus clarkii]
MMQVAVVGSKVVALGCGTRSWYPVAQATAALAGLQTVRWRKPRWLPPAKSKMFKVPPRVTVPEEEEIEMKRLYNIYRTQVKAVRYCSAYLFIYLFCNLFILITFLKQSAEEEAEHQYLMEYNHQENLRVAALREERVKMEFEADLARIEVSREKLAKKTLEAEEEALRIITETQELVKTFIKQEDLEKAIETALANPVDYNYAIDQEGHIFRGSKTRPGDIAKEDWEKLISVAQ